MHIIRYDKESPLFLDFLVVRKSDGPQRSDVVDFIMQPILLPSRYILEAFPPEHNPTQDFPMTLSLSKCGSSNR